ncbi:TPA: YceO family protein [Citrobacter freundii]
MRRIIDFLVNNIREHLILYIVLWLLLAGMDIIYLLFFDK